MAFPTQGKCVGCGRKCGRLGQWFACNKKCLKPTLDKAVKAYRKGLEISIDGGRFMNGIRAAERMHVPASGYPRLY